jgi:hypothetical protein
LCFAKLMTPLDPPSPAGLRVAETTTAQRILAEERKAHIVVGLGQQLEMKRARDEAAKEREAYFQEILMRDLEVAAAKDDARRAEHAAKKVAVNDTIARQLEERAFLKLLDLEAKEQEGALMLAMAKKASDAAEAAVVAKKEVQRVKARETAEANRMFAERDAVRKARDADADEAIRQFQLAKAAREEAAEHKRRADKIAADKLAAQMIAQQSRAADNRAAEDEAKGAAYEEKRTLADRALARAEAERKEADKKATAEGLAYQLALKVQRKVVADERNAEFEARMVETMAAAVLKEEEALGVKRAKALEAKQALVEQKAARDKQKALDFKRPIEERRQQSLEDAAQRIVVERFREDVTRRMASSSLPGNFVHAAKTLKHRVE